MQSAAKIKSLIYEVSLLNSGAENTVSLVIPAPQDSALQTITTPPTFSIKPAAINSDPLYGNTYAVWTLHCKPNERKKLSMNLSLTTQAIQKSLPELSLSEYKRDENFFRYTRSSTSISPENPFIKKVASEILLKNTTLGLIASACNEYVIANLTYGNPIPGLYSATQVINQLTLRQAQGKANQPINQSTHFDCGGYDTLLISLLNACGIPARIVSGFWLNLGSSFISYFLPHPSVPTMHAWIEIMLPDGSWTPADPSVEQLHRLGRSKKIGRLGEVGDDRIAMSVGCDLEINMNNQTVSLDILQTPFIYPACDNIKVNYSVAVVRSR